mmetsp:Transcript_15941/g.41224  ORF Transcript_15941/g.41224 Transcript_15941/m.41224 type:complete len:235 (-) Transcript_15941:694-1398(-)
MDSARYEPRPYSEPVMLPASLILKSVLQMFFAAAALVPWKRYHSLTLASNRSSPASIMSSQTFVEWTSLMVRYLSRPCFSSKALNVAGSTLMSRSISAFLIIYLRHILLFSLRSTVCTMKPRGTCHVPLCLWRSRDVTSEYVSSSSFWKRWTHVVPLAVPLGTTKELNSLTAHTVHQLLGYSMLAAPVSADACSFRLWPQMHMSGSCREVLEPGAAQSESAGWQKFAKWSGFLL